MTAYIDTETTGLDPKKHGIIQIACLIVDDHKIIDEINLMIDPFSYKEDCLCGDKALEINGRTLDEIEHFPNSDEQLQIFLDFLAKHTVEDKLQIAGYNVDFDIKFIKEWFSSCEIKFNDFFNHKTLDVLSLVRHCEYFNIFQTEDHKLATMLEHFDFQYDTGFHFDSFAPHDALSDITATFYIHEKIRVLMAIGFGIEEEHTFDVNGCRVCGRWVTGDLCSKCEGELK
jgi:DNA polymerase III subunit epsilon